MSYAYKSSHSSSVASKYARSRTGQRRSQNNRGKGQYIDPSRFVKQATLAAEAEAYVAKHQFSDFPLHPVLQRNLQHKSYTTPSPIQDQTIPHGLSGTDIIGIANTGTGKTAAFALPLLHKLITDPQAAALIIAPTRELAQQIEAECLSFVKGTSLPSVLIIGGAPMGRQLRALERRPRLIIGTPGRIKDHLQRGSLKLDKFNTVVLDEVDRMLDMGFVHDVRTILSNLDSDRQSFFFSATMSDNIRQLINSFTTDPVTVSLKVTDTSDSVHQDVVHFQGNIEKIDRLHDILIKEEVAKAIVFDETKYGVERLSKELIARGFSADAIHGGKSQGQRQRALARFKQSEVTILVATDVAARGIDVADISHVINYNIPKTYDDYVHRVGRAGRAGRVGYALTFVPQ